MANTIDKQTIIDGSKHLVVKIYLESDGASGELSDVVLIDASTYSPAFTDAKLVSIHANLSGFTAKLEWDATTDAPIMAVPDYEVHFTGNETSLFDGIANNAGTGVTGDVLISTTGFTAAGDYGTIIIHLVKKNNV